MKEKERKKQHSLGLPFFMLQLLTLKWTYGTSSHNTRLQKLKCFPGTTFKTQKQLKENLNKQPNKQWKKSQSKEQNLN